MQASLVEANGSEQSTQEPPLGLIQGSMMRCPNCEQLRDPLNERMFKRLDRNERYAIELNVVYQCVKSTGGCGHIFSPGDQRILMAFLAGDLVPAEHLRKVQRALKAQQEVVSTDARSGG